MPITQKQKLLVPKAHVPRWVVGTLVFLIALGAVLTAFVFVFPSLYKNKIFPGTRVGDIQLGGKTPTEAQQLLQSRMDIMSDHGTTLDYNGQIFNIIWSIGDPSNPDLSTAIISFDAQKTIDNIMAVQGQRSQVEQVMYWLIGWRVTPSFQLNAERLHELLAEALNSYQEPAVNAKLVIAADGAISIAPEKNGQAFDFNQIVSQVQGNIVGLSDAVIVLALEPDTPQITEIGAEALVPVARQVLATAPFALMYGDRSWELSLEQVRQWLEFQVIDGAPSIGLNQASLGDYLKEVAKEVDVPVQEGKFTMTDGRVTEFQPSQKGLELQIDKSSITINEKIKQVGVKEIDLAVVETLPTVNTGDVNGLGIVELIGEGHSNFKGSPKNRRHNISVGANTLNGVLIKPGEEFSLVKTLGKIEASTGYLPELVIKGNKTVPEYGGGLCQIGTTTFRAALDAGLPILERKNHSYRVSYYEPAGTDATIYDPKPDFRFLNDTGHYVLFTTEMTGDNLYFRFYGTKDGRTVTQTTPRIFNFVSPGSTKLIETTDLKPGEKKCTEKAHTGADAEFTRVVTYPSGEKKTDVFKSHYKPWPEVCLIGVEKLPADKE